LKITRINITPKVTTAVSIRVTRIGLPAGIPALSNAYEYYNITSSVADENLSAVRIRFAVANDWIAENNIINTTIAMYRWTGSWEKLSTSLLSKDINYTYFEAISPGFSYFGVAGEKEVIVGCPDRPDWAVDTGWSTCIAGSDGVYSQSRTVYKCNAQTNWIWQPSTQSQNCCPENCPQAPSEWSACIADKQNRTEYKCTVGIWKCEPITITKSCVSRETAENAIKEAENAIAIARTKNKNVTEAENYLTQARNAFAQGNFEAAKTAADMSVVAAGRAAELPTFVFPLIPVILIVIAAVAIVIVFLVWRRRESAGVVRCVVCGQPTRLRNRCAFCGGFVCLTHTKNIGGKIYCTNCARRLGYA
jgi:PGF-pre-PGF domain-containing protein